MEIYYGEEFDIGRFYRVIFNCSFSVAILLLPMDAEAKTKVATIEGVSYNVSSFLSDNLKLLISRRVSATLNSDKTFTGLVKEAGNHFLHLQKIENSTFKVSAKQESIRSKWNRFDGSF